MTKALILISLMAVIWTGQPAITISPFSISFKTFHLMIPLFIVLAIWHFKYNESYLKGYQHGVNDMTKATIDELNKRCKQNEQ